MEPITKHICQILSRHKFTLSDEKVLQEEIGKALTEGGINYQREVRLSDRDCIDFLIQLFPVGIEVKIKGSAAEIYRQCKRYCESEKIGILLLVTNRSMGLPEEINGKRCYVLSLGKGWL